MSKETNQLLNEYCFLRDRQIAVFDRCAKKHGLTINELFVLDILWFTPDGCTQKYICDRLSVNKQTIAAITSRFKKKGYIELLEVLDDRRNKKVILTEDGKKYTSTIIPAVARAENIAIESLTIEDARTLIRLTATFTENMEKEFAKLEKNNEN
ncbi:MAG: MarR family transcriptional regulator [Prevotella sp.]|nr:MarR family transcriptional regulator [Staphylococcus sp.]MCM1350116.1 MarR family transcriptional regulator [Prevotella sp.]